MIATETSYYIIIITTNTKLTERVDLADHVALSSHLPRTRALHQYPQGIYEGDHQWRPWWALRAHILYAHWRDLGAGATVH